MRSDTCIYPNVRTISVVVQFAIDQAAAERLLRLIVNSRRRRSAVCGAVVIEAEMRWRWHGGAPEYAHQFFALNMDPSSCSLANDIQGYQSISFSLTICSNKADGKIALPQGISRTARMKRLYNATI